MRKIYLFIAIGCVLSMAWFTGCSKNDSGLATERIELTDADLFVNSEEYQMFLAYKDLTLNKMEEAIESLPADLKERAESILEAIWNETDTDSKLVLYEELEVFTGINYLSSYRNIAEKYNEITKDYNFTKEELERASVFAIVSKTRVKSSEEWSLEECTQECTDEKKAADRKCDEALTANATTEEILAYGECIAAANRAEKKCNDACLEEEERRKQEKKEKEEQEKNNNG